LISVICVSNNPKILQEDLVASLGKQSAEHEFIQVDNRDGKHRSAASAMNAAGKKGKGKYLMFVHQDIVLGADDFLWMAERFLDSLPNVGIAGVAGRLDARGVLTNITHGDPPTHAGHIRIEKPEIVQTVDECLFFVPRIVFEEMQFDDRTCDDWHLYAVDYALSVKRLGLEVYVLPLVGHHRSGGASMSRMYHRTLAKVARKHRKEFPWIHTSLGSWRTGIPISLQLLSINTKRRLRGTRRG